VFLTSAPDGDEWSASQSAYTVFRTLYYEATVSDRNSFTKQLYYETSTK